MTHFRLTGAGAAAFAGALSLLGVAIDLARGPDLATAFGLCFLLACVVVAARVRWGDARPALVSLPLIYLAALTVAALMNPPSGSTSWLASTFFAVVTGLMVHAPDVLVGVALAVVILLLRGRRRFADR